MDVEIFALSREYRARGSELAAIFDRVAGKGEFVLGREVEAFEAAFAAYVGTSFATGVGSGTDALRVGGLACGLVAGDKVVTTPNTYIATVMALSVHGIVPVFCDIDVETSTMDPDALAAVLDREKGVKLVIPVHLYGHPCYLDEIVAVCREHGLKILEDSCQAHGARYRGRKVGCFGDCAAFSFYPTKNLGCFGDGGAVVTNDESLYRHAYGFHSHYRTPPNEGPANAAASRNGINLRMAEFQGALLLAQMTRLEEQARTREQNAAYLTSLLREVPGIKPAGMYEGCTRNAYHIYMMRYDADAFAGLPRAVFIKAMRAEGIPISPGYGRLNQEPFLENTLNSRTYRAVYSESEIAAWRERNNCPNNDRVAREGIWLGQPVLLAARTDMEDIVTAAKKVRARAADIAKSLAAA